MCDTLEEICVAAGKYREALFDSDMRGLLQLYREIVASNLDKIDRSPDIALEELRDYRRAAGEPLVGANTMSQERELGNLFGQQMIRRTIAPTWVSMDLLHAEVRLISEELPDFYFIDGREERMVERFKERIEPRYRGEQPLPFDLFRELSIVPDDERTPILARWIVTSYQRYVRAAIRANTWFPSHWEELGGEAVLPPHKGNSDSSRAVNCELVHECLGRLPKSHRDVLTRRYLEGMSTTALADLLDCTIDAVYMRLFHARREFQVVFNEARERNEG